MADRLERASERLRTVTNETRLAIAEFTDASTRLAALRTEALVGILGGISGMVVAYVGSVVWPSISFFPSGVLLGAFGMVTGILAGRWIGSGPRESDADRRRRLTAENDELDRRLMGRLLSLPPDAPGFARETLYRQLTKNSLDLAAKLRSGPPPPEQHSADGNT